MDYDLRLERHRVRSKNSESNKFHKALKHFGFDNFKWRKMFETNSKKEFEYIKKYDTIENGYNSTRGRKLLDDDKENIKEDKSVSDAQRGLMNSVVDYKTGKTKKHQNKLKILLITFL